MHYLQRDHASGTGYEYATTLPVIAGGDVTTSWGERSKAHPIADEAEAAKWGRLLGCAVTMFSLPAVAAPAAVDAATARKARVAAYLAKEQRKAEGKPDR